MKGNKDMNTITNIIYTALALFAFACFALSPTARAVTPAPDGGYPGENTAEGEDALFSLTTGLGNTAVGFNALFSNTAGGFNTAVGWLALQNNIGDNQLQGLANTAIGATSMNINTTGRNNTAVGASSLENNEIGSFNVAVGNSTLGYNIDGSNNTAVGEFAIAFSHFVGSNNTALGYHALSFGFEEEHFSGSDNIAIGANAGANLTTGSNNIDIGNAGVEGEANTIRIGTQGTQTKTFIAGISGAGVTGLAVKVNADGQLGTPPSSARFKTEIKPMDKASEAILALKPVTFRYKKDIDADRTPQFGLVAEDVAKVNPDLVVHDQDGKVYTVRYEAVNAMLLNEFLKEHAKVEKLEATLAQRHKDFEAAVAELKGQIQKVSAQLELSKSAPQTVLNNQ
jgi:Chaperone of endosialidase